MAMLFHDDPAMMKCKCGSTIFVEVRGYTYKKINDRLGEGFVKELAASSLKCIRCDALHPDMKDLSKHRITEKPE